MPTNPDEMLENSRDLLDRARKYVEEAKNSELSDEARKILEGHAKELLEEAKRWTEMAKKTGLR